MGSRVARVLVAVACAAALGGCESWNKTADWLTKPPGAETAASAPAPETTGSVPILADPLPGDDPAATGDPNDDLNLGKRHFREMNYGLAELHFRRAVEKHPNERGEAAEAWLGLAASYDRLRRFELADRAYGQAAKILGPTPEILNNHGYSYLLRGDYAHARAKLRAAYQRDPRNPYIQANLDLLEKSERRR